MVIFLNQLIKFLFEQCHKSSPLNFTQYSPCCPTAQRS